MRRAHLFLLSMALASSCTVGPNYRPESASELGVPRGWSVPTIAGTEDLTQWWQNFNDPVLSTLVSQAAAANLDLAQAIARLRQAREALVISRAALFPNVSGSARYQRTQPITGNSFLGSLDSLSLGLDASYQVDLFGGVRRDVEASRAEYAASGLDYATALISIEAEVARNYVLARSYQAQLQDARANLAVQDDNLEIVGFRVKAGLVSALDLEQARASRAQVAATIPSLEQQYNAAVSRLGVLIGQGPGAVKPIMLTPEPIPTGPEHIAAGIPADVLRQRPDVRSAERKLAAATAQIGVAQAQLYPALSIGGNINAAAANPAGLFDNLIASLFASVTQAIFNGGRLEAQVRSSRAATEGALAAYKSSVLTALEDIENAIVALQSAEERERQFAIALDAANNSTILARSQYRTGLIDFSTLNTQEASLISARNGAVQARSDQATALIALYTALGGGWDPKVVPAAPSTPAAPGN